MSLRERIEPFDPTNDLPLAHRIYREVSAPAVILDSKRWSVVLRLMPRKACNASATEVSDNLGGNSAIASSIRFRRPSARLTASSTPAARDAVRGDQNAKLTATTRAEQKRSLCPGRSALVEASSIRLPGVCAGCHQPRTDERELDHAYFMSFIRNCRPRSVHRPAVDGQAEAHCIGSSWPGRQAHEGSAMARPPRSGAQTSSVSIDSVAGRT